MGKIGDIVFLVLLLAGLLIAFPEYLDKVFENKIYTIFAGLGAFLIIFLLWLKRKDN